MTDLKQTLATQCFTKLTESILKGELRPGDKLLCEKLKKRYGVGMSPIREALAKLAASHHLVAFEEHKGYSVAKIDTRHLIDEIQTFAEIESLCFRYAINLGNDEWEGSIISALHCLKKVENGKAVNFFTWSPLNICFHNALVACCPLQSLLEIRQELYQRHQWYILLSYKFADRSVILANHQEHQEIAHLAINRNVGMACEKLSFHITSGIPELIAKLTRLGLIHENK